MDEPAAKIAFAIASAGRSRRTDLNYRYATIAMAALDLDTPHGDQRYGWLHKRTGALTEIGRAAEHQSFEFACLLADALIEDVAGGAVRTTRDAERRLRALRRAARAAPGQLAS
jgi:hypothetical protein